MKDCRNVLKQMKLSVGQGEDHFTMNRGSFTYRTKMHWTHACITTSLEDQESGFVIHYSDPETGKKFEAQVREENGRYTVHFAGNDESVNRWIITIPCDPEEKIYGCGETYAKFNLKGEAVRIFVAEHQNSKRIAGKLIREKLTGVHPDHVLKFSKYESYYAEPLFVSSQRYYLYADTKQYAVFDFRRQDAIRLCFEEPPVLTMEAADSFAELSEKQSSLLGRQKELPDWIYDGMILAMQGGTETLEKKIETARKAGVKVCGVWSQDWCGCRKTGFGYQVMWNWEWDQELYPHLDQKIQEWKKEGIRFLGYINPFMAIEKPLYQYASAHGYCVKDQEGKDYLVKITTFPAAMIDFTNPEAYAWYKNLIKTNMIGFGLSGWMADFGEYLPMDCVLQEGDPARLHNEWPAIWARLNQEAIAETHMEKEVFFFTRAGYTPTIRYSPMMWTGDQHVDWSVDDGLPSVIPASLSLAMSGCGISHSDAGGYTTIMHMKRSAELLERWLEMNAFSPLLRTHEGNQPVNDVQFDADPETLRAAALASSIHAGLKDYLKACVRQCASRGTPVMRPLFYHYDEPRAYEETREYLLGRDLLIAPVLEKGAKKRTVWLPQDTWIEASTGKEYQGGTCTVSAPIGVPPVFVRTSCPSASKIIAMIQTCERSAS